MDIGKMLAELKTEKDRVEQAIRALEAVSRDGGRAVEPAVRRGRKQMSKDERLAVSERMRRYWADRKGKPSR